MRIPVLYRIFGILKTYLDNYQYSDKLFKKLQSRKIFFVQIGANDGVSQDPIFRYSEKWSGILIEPLKEPFEKLKYNYANKSDGKCFVKLAIGPNDGTVEMYVPKINENNKSFATKIASLKQNSLLKSHDFEKVVIKQITLSTLIQKHKVKSIDLLVMDVEGYELDILSTYSFNLKPKIIFMETRFYSYNDLVSFYSRMKNLGYSIFPEKDNCLMINKVVKKSKID